VGLTRPGPRPTARRDGRPITRRAALTAVLGLATGLAASARAAVPTVDMAEVRRLAREPVEIIFAGVPIGRVTDADYWTTVHGSPKPVVVIFYASQEKRSRNLASLARYLALEFHEVVGFYGYRIAAGAAPEPAALARVDQLHGVKRIPASLFYDNDRGAMELEKTDYSVPSCWSIGRRACCSGGRTTRPSGSTSRRTSWTDWT
jgi:hypothetical protein